MSYILDALRKADAERERGSVPDLHAQLLPHVAGAGEAAEGGPGVVRWVLLGGGLVVLAGATWFWLGSSDAPPPPPGPPPCVPRGAPARGPPAPRPPAMRPSRPR